MPKLKNNIHSIQRKAYLKQKCCQSLAFSVDQQAFLFGSEEADFAREVDDLPPDYQKQTKSMRKNA